MKNKKLIKKILRFNNDREQLIILNYLLNSENKHLKEELNLLF